MKKFWLLLVGCRTLTIGTSYRTFHAPAEADVDLWRCLLVQANNVVYYIINDAQINHDGRPKMLFGRTNKPFVALK
jgi:hypothetical protein